jgi:hypothetical protein
VEVEVEVVESELAVEAEARWCHPWYGRVFL